MAHQNQFVLVYLLVLVSFNTLYDCIANEEDPTSLQLNDDLLGLIVFKSDLHDTKNMLSSWNEDDESPCSWSFIQCDPNTRRVTEISMDGLGLSGKMGRGLKELQSLKILSLSNNNLSGNIATEISQLPMGLKSLNLSHNRFSGQIPSSIANLKSLRVLDLSENMISKSIPDNIFADCSLHYLSLARNSLEGPLPSTLSKCTTLNVLNLSNNHFTGYPFLNTGIWSLGRIRVLDLSMNEFSGLVPVGMLALHNMKKLHLQGNQFSGPIPFDIGFCPHLNELDLSRNEFIDGLPDSLRLLKSLTILDLSNNKLTGEFPFWIGNLTSLVSIDVSKNGLRGSLPMSIGSLSSIQSFVLSDNNLNGIIPSSLASCTQLTTIQLRGNAFGGSIPDYLFSMGLENLDLSWNKLSGSIPPGSSRLFESLLAMDLSGNNLRGNIPPEMGLFTNLGYLNLSWNNLNSRIPPELGYLQKLTVLDLRYSALYGSIPGDLCESRSLTVLQLDGNSLSGQIPAQIANCSALKLLSLSQNRLGGLIPCTMVKLKRLQILRLEFNQLNGEIPTELGTLQDLVAVNVSYNKLVGRLPQEGIFPSLDRTSIEGNLGICSPLLRGPCKMNVPKPLVLDPYAYPDKIHSHEAEPRDHHHRFLSLSAIIAMAAAIAILAGVIIITLLNATARRKIETVTYKATESMFSTSSRSFDQGGSPSMGRLILFDSSSSGGWTTNPESLFTNASNNIGGDVYKTTLEQGGRTVAIKILPNSNILQHPEDFDREVRLLGRVKHPNLVPLRGYYWTPQLQLLVSDHISNGSLQTERPPLLWATRFKIMLGTAKALAHLHHSCSPPIIHYNLKPSNILLDESYNAKVSDFGLMRVLAKADRNVMSNRFKGAFGYMAPELTCQGLRVNEKCDVYGYGVMMLEMVMGIRPMENGEDNVVVLNENVRVLMEQGKMLECVDESMGNYPEDEVLPVLKLALVCTSEAPSNRPSMAEVVQILQVIKTPIPSRIEPY
ncbi:hypothetical protein V2J09_014425 [Rumex salicifolius]